MRRTGIELASLFAAPMLLAAALCLAIPAAFAAEPAASANRDADDAVPASLSLAEAERIFLERGLDLLIAENGVEGAQGDLAAAGAVPNPNLAVTADVVPKLNRDILYKNIGKYIPANVWGLGIGLSDNAAIEDQLSGKRSLRILAMSKALAAARLNVEDIKRVELPQLREAYVAAVMAKLNLDAAKESFETFDTQLKLNQMRYDHGAINALDLSRVLQAQLEALQAIDQAQDGVQQAMSALLFLLGVRSGLPQVALTSGIGYAPSTLLKAATIQSLHELATKNRTDVKIAVANMEQADAALRQAKRSRLPDIQLNLGYSEICEGANCSSEPAFSFGLQGNLPIFYQQHGEIQRASANVLAAQRTVEKAKAQVLSDVAQAYAGFDAARKQVERMESKLLEQAKLSRDLAQHMYQNGAASLIDFFDAQRQYVATKLEYNQDLANYWSAVYQLEQATATPLR